jgi:hypothetical protein
MMANWLLAAALYGSLTTTVPAEPLLHRTEPPVQVEIRGRLQVLHPRTGLDLPFQYAIEADGQRFHLGRNGILDKAIALDGQLVIVTGVLDFNTVQVTDLRQPKDDALLQHVRVRVTGTLEHDLSFSIPRRGDVMLFETWRVRVGERTYELDIADARVKAEAEKLIGQPVVLEGKLHGDRITVGSIAPVYQKPDDRLPPNILDRLPPEVIVPLHKAS